ILMLAEVTRLDVQALSAMAGRQLPLFSLLVPAWLVWVMAGWRATVAVWPALLVCGGSFALVQFLTANLHGPWLVDVAGGLVSLVSLALFLRVWHPREIWRFPGEEPVKRLAMPYTSAQIASAWVPWVLLTAFVFVWGLPGFKDPLNQQTTAKVQVPGLHEKVARHPPVVKERDIEKALYTVNPLTATG